MKRIVISSAVLALAIGGVGVGSAAPAVTKITGGGQTMVPAEGGAGDTVGFNAQVDADGNVKGQFQYVDRTGGTGQGQQVAHGEVTCATVFSRPDEGGAGGVAVFGGELRDGTAFRVDVTDNGAGNASTDLILVRTGADAEGDNEGLCDQEDEPEETPDLNRGNVTIHKAKA
ncbi:MAG: hypothetical protein ACYDAN_16065 [Candidatus Limnocylindrales bacterium]